MTKIEFSKRLKGLRGARQLTLAAISSELALSQRLYEYYEMEKNAVLPSCKNLMKLANYFNCSIDYLLCQTDNPQRN